MKATLLGAGTALAMLAMAGTSVSFALADTASTTATTTATVTATTTAAPTGGSTLSGLLATLQSLIARVHQLQQQIAGVKTQVGSLLNTNYQVGSSSPEIQKIQQLLASDPSIYPQGLTTGYFGSLTSQAISRFQAKNGLPVTGTLDTATKALLQEYMNRATSTIPHGFLSNGQVRSEVEQSFAAHCHEAEYGDGQFCGQVQAHLGAGGNLGSSTVPSVAGSQGRPSIIGGEGASEHAQSPERTGSSTAGRPSDFQSWWAPFLSHIRNNGDHGSGNSGRDNGAGNGSTTRSGSDN